MSIACAENFVVVIAMHVIGMISIALIIIAVSDRALEDRDLALEVAAHKQMFFAEKAKDSDDIDYAKSVSGALCLVPEGEAFDSLHKDYIQMIEAGLFHSKPAPFEDMVR